MSEKVELELKLKGGDKAVKTLGQLEQELDQARQAIKEVEVGSDAFNKLADKIQKAGSEVKTLEKKMEGLEPQQKAEAFLKMGEGIAGGFAVAQGAMALAGVESENLEKLQVKVQSAIAIAQGIRMMSEAALMLTTAKRVALEKLALVRDKAGIAVTYARSIATGVWATAQGVLTGAVSATTVALKALKFAIAATGIGALVIAIIAIGKAVYDWSKATKDLTAEQIKLAEATIRRNEKFLEERDLQKELAKAETDAEKRLVIKTKNLNKQLDGLKKTIELQKENKEALKNTDDLSKEEIKTLKLKRSELSRTAEEYKRQVTRIDGLIVKIGEEIAAEEKAAQKEKERDDERKRRREERKAQRIQEAEELRTLEQELELLRIEDDNERAAAQIEQDRQIHLEKVANAENAREQILLINEKYDNLELERIQTQQEKEQEEYDRAIKEHSDRVWQEQQENSDRIKAARDKAVAEEKERLQKIADFKDSLGSQGFALAKKLGGKNEKLQKNLAIAETAFFTGKSIMRAVSDIPAPWGLIQAGIHGAMGIAQIANIKSEKIGGASGGGGGADVTEPMLPSSTGAFSLGGAQEQPAVKAFVVESEITDSQAQMADINRRSTI